MNAIRRRQLEELSSRIEEIQRELWGVKYEEDDCRESMPENLQNSSRYEESEACSDNLEDAMQYIDDALDAISAAIGNN